MKIRLNNLIIYTKNALIKSMNCNLKLVVINAEAKNCDDYVEYDGEAALTMGC